MASTKYRLGDLIELSDEKNENLEYGEEALRGLSIQKCFISTKADMNGVSLRPYYLVKPKYFSYVPVTSRNGEKITLAYNNSDSTYIVSSSYIVFYVKNEGKLLPEFLFMFFNRSEFDRYARFNSWGSARETFSWDEMCDTEIMLPDLDIQKNCVNAHLGIQENISAISSGIERLTNTLDIYMDQIAHSSSRIMIGEFIEETDNRNIDMLYGTEDVMGMTITKQIIPTKANMNGTAIDKFKIVYPKEFVYNPRTHGKRIGLGFNQTKKPFIISWNNASFKILGERQADILPEYLYLCICREEWDREACFRSWGSSTEVFSWDALCEMKIAVPEIAIQQAIVRIYEALVSRKNILDRLNSIQKNICPILVRGSN